MECIKVEAIRAKAIAEKKLLEKDVDGAKEFALRAQNLFPGLEGISQFLEILDVYICAEKRVNGLVDRYAVLGVDPLADDRIIRTHYMKLARNLHPDKNRTVGAEGAFKIVSEAWSLLSDRAKRMAYDQKRCASAVHQQSNTRNLSTTVGCSDFRTCTSTNSSSERHQNKSAMPRPDVPSSNPSSPNTFWTSCNKCRMQYQYLRDFLNRSLSCPNCREIFLAEELPSAPAHDRQSTWPSFLQQQNVRHCHAVTNSLPPLGRKYNSVPRVGPMPFTDIGPATSLNLRENQFIKSGGVRSELATASSTAHVSNISQSFTQYLKPGHEEAQTAATNELSIERDAETSKKTGASSRSVKVEMPMKKRRCIDLNKSIYIEEETVFQQTGLNEGGGGSQSGNQKGSSKEEKAGGSGCLMPKRSRDTPRSEIRIMLAAKARMEIQKKLNEWSFSAASEEAHEVGKDMEKEPNSCANDVPETFARNPGKETKMNDACADAKKPIKGKKSSTSTAMVDSDPNASGTVAMSVPDPDFYDFDKDRVEKSFDKNQVWAVYDNDDGMPRYYALIQNVISKRPFKVHISWLNSKSNSEFGPLNWIGFGYTKTGGDFWVGKRTIHNALNSFSHRVKWTKGPKGVIQILPKKGDVWALYRNWSPEWNDLTPDEVRHKYDMVEVLEDFREDQGVAVARLAKLAGFKAVFHQHLYPGAAWTIPREEMFRFSHQVPSYMLTGQEASNSPKGCLELDPAAMPLELLQVITESKKETGKMGEA